MAWDSIAKCQSVTNCAGVACSWLSKRCVRGPSDAATLRTRAPGERTRQAAALEDSCSTQMQGS